MKRLQFKEGRKGELDARRLAVIHMLFTCCLVVTLHFT